MSQIVYVLTLKTWEEFDRPHHWYGRIHWEAPVPCSCDAGTGGVGFAETCLACGVDHSGAGFQSDDSLALPDADEFCSARHDTKESAIDGAKRWFQMHSKTGDVLVRGTWSLCGWVRDFHFDVLEGQLDPQTG